VACDLQSLSVHIAGHPEVRATSFKESYACACKVLFFWMAPQGYLGEGVVAGFPKAQPHVKTSVPEFL
jgi:hypothetical protein